MGWIRRLFAVLGLLIVVAVGGLGTALYLAGTGRSAPLVKALAARAGRLFDGQATDHLDLDVLLRPRAGMLSARARLSVRALEPGRRRFYFLLNHALRLQSVRIEGEPKASAYQLPMMIVVDVGRPLKADEGLDIALEYEGQPSAGLFGLGTGVLDRRSVLLNADDFWIPLDLQSQFTAEVAVTLPADMTLVHSGELREQSRRGNLQRVRWTYKRPLPAFSLVAGPYRSTEARSGEQTFRVWLADDVELDAERILDSMDEANGMLAERFGPSGHPIVSLFVNRTLRRGYNDGAGVIGLSLRYFRRGDYGFGIIAHELGHNWWGATVMEKWLRAGTGGEWLVEGLAELSSLLAIEEKYGAEALTRQLARESFDPRRPRAISEMSVIDNALDEHSAREIIYDKGAYVAMMLRRVLGDEAFSRGLRQFVDRFRFKAATERDLEAVLSEATGTDLTAFFDFWVRSGAALDLALDAGDTPGSVVLRAVTEGEGEVEAGAPAGEQVVGESDVWVFSADGGEPQQRHLRPGEQLDVGDAAAVVVDPSLEWADMRRFNNRFPGRRFPAYVAVSAGGVRAVVESGDYAWSPSTIRVVQPDDVIRGNWELETTSIEPPQWVDENRLLLSSHDGRDAAPLLELLDTRDGRQRALGRGSAAAAVAGSVFAARGDRLVRWRVAADEAEQTIARLPGHRIDRVAVSRDGKRVAYAATRGNDLELRVRNADGSGERTLLAWDRDVKALAWSADGERLFVAIGGQWDWQVWAVPVDGGAIETLAREAAAFADLAVSPDGRWLAFSAAPALDYPRNRREVFFIDLETREVTHFEVLGGSVGRITWLDAGTVLAVVSPLGNRVPWHLPEERWLSRISLSEGSVTTFE